MKLQLIKKTAVAAALSVCAFAASAMTPMQDESLSQVSGQDGVSIAADLNIRVGSFVYTDTDAVDATTGLGGGSISFNNIAFTGTIGVTMDIISNASFLSDVFNPTVLGVTEIADAVDPAAQGAALAAFYPGGDVVKIAIPEIELQPNAALDMSVAAIRMGGSTASYGSIAMNDIQLQGTKVYIWAH
ncbi:hypothetical protein GCM10027343_31440 [Noviherbaspirillum agri]